MGSVSHNSEEVSDLRSERVQPNRHASVGSIVLDVCGVRKS